jgi:tetratricopeptide (TPR) repeat protein
VQFRLGESAAAKENLQLVLRAKPDHQAAIALGREAAATEYRANQFAESQATIEALLAAGVRDAGIFNLLAWCHHRQNRLPEAVSAMRNAIELEPAVETNYDHLAQILLDRRQNIAAAETISKALEIAPASFQAYKLKGRLEMQTGNAKRALESFAHAVELNGSDPESLLGLGLAQEKLFQYQAAAASFEKGITRFPRDPFFCQAYGRMLLQPGATTDPDAESRAVSLLEKALALDNSLSEAHYQLGRLLLAKGQAEKSLEHLETAAKLNPLSNGIHLSLANAYRRLGRDDDAAREFQLLRSLPPREGDPD